jgi:hypothetical protein
VEITGKDTVGWCVNVEVTVLYEGAAASVQIFLYDDMKNQELSESLVRWMVEKTGYVFMSYELKKLKIANTGVCHLTMFQSMTDRIYDGGTIR